MVAKIISKAIRLRDPETQRFTGIIGLGVTAPLSPVVGFVPARPQQVHASVSSVSDLHVRFLRHPETFTRRELEREAGVHAAIAEMMYGISNHVATEGLAERVAARAKL